MEYVVDASVAVKWLLPEVHTDQASLLLEEDAILAAPDLLYAEVGSVLWKRVVRGEISSGQAQQALNRLFDVAIEIAPVQLLLERALELACRHRRSVYDSLYLALAVQQNVACVTADKRLYSAIQNTDLAQRVVFIADLQ